MISVRFQDKPFNITVIQVYALTNNAEEGEVEWFYEPTRPSRVFSCWKRVFAMTSVFSWQNSISLCPASFHIPRPNLPVTPGVS